MADEQYESEARDHKAWRRVVAACRKLAKQIGNPELGEAVASSNHTDIATRDMRRSEALAALLEALVIEEKAEAKSETKASKGDKAE